MEQVIDMPGLAQDERTESRVASRSRESMRVLPKFIQPFLTWMTGHPLADQAPMRWTPMHHLSSATLSLFGGIMLSALASTYWGLWTLLLVPGWLFTVHGGRKLQVMVLHHCSHYSVLGSKRSDTFLGRAISVLLMIQNFDEYRYEHIYDHHSSNHMTLKDPTVKFLLVVVGFRVGMTQQQLWNRLVTSLISPAFHVKFMSIRISSIFKTSSWSHRLSSVAYISLLLCLVTVTSTWVQFLCAYLFPLTILYQISACLRLCVKHTFPEPGFEKKRDKEVLASFTNGVFLGEPAPVWQANSYRYSIEWVRWTFRMVFIHLVSRLFVLVGDTVCHDYHHRHPMKDWANYIFARHEDIREGHPGWPPYTEVWGLVNALNTSFKSLSDADPAQFQISNIGSTTMADLVNGIME